MTELEDPQTLISRFEDLSQCLENLMDLGYSTDAVIKRHKSATIENFLSKLPNTSFMHRHSKPKEYQNDLEVIIDLFVFGMEVPLEVFDRIQRLDRSLNWSILLKQSHATAQAKFRIIPFQSRYFFSDFDDLSDQPNRVMAPSYSSISLLKYIQQHDIKGRLCDMGCGTGFLGSLQPNTSKLILNDLNPRCIEFAKLNTMLNHQEATFVKSSWEDIQGDVDTIIFNTPSLPNYKKSGHFVNDYGQDCNQILKEFYEYWTQQSNIQQAFTWVCICIPRNTSLNEFLTTTLSTSLQFVEDVNSPFALQQNAIQEKKMPLFKWLTNSKEDEAALFQQLSEWDIGEVRSGVIHWTRD